MSDLRISNIHDSLYASGNENTKCYTGLMNSFLNLKDDYKFVFKLKIYQQQEWLRAADDIFVWIPVLNRLNSIFKKIAEKHYLNIHIPTLKGNTDTKPNLTESIANNNVTDKLETSYDAFLTQLPTDIETFILDMINFILFLFENTTKRSVDSSVDGILPLLNVPNMEIKLGCMKVLTINASRGFKSYSKLLNKDVKEKSSIIASSLLCSTSSNTEQTKSLDLFEFLTKLTSKPFDLSDNNELSIPEKNFLPFSFEYYSEENDCTEIFNLDKETIINSSYDELLLLVKEQKLIPEHYWFKISIELYLAKTFATTKNKLNLKNDTVEIKKLFDLLNPFVQLKFYSFSLLNCSLVDTPTSHQVADLDNKIFNCLGKLTLSGYSSENQRTDLSLKKIIYSALFAMKCLSETPILLENINKHLFGEDSYVHFVNLLERIKVALSTNKNIDTKYNVQFFSLLEILSNTISELSVHTEIIDKITKLFMLPDCKDYTTLWSLAKLLRLFFDLKDLRTIFENAGGYTFLKNRLNREIDFCATNLNINVNVEYHTKVYSTIQFKQLSFLSIIVTLFSKIIYLESNDIVKNLLDSSILNTLNKILLNINIFGLGLISQVLEIIDFLLTKDPFFFEILQKAGTISIVLDNFQEFVAPHSDLLVTLPEVLSAICLNKDGLQDVISKNILQFLFEPLKNIELAKILLFNSDSIYIKVLDEMYNDHPDLQKLLEDEFLKVLNEFDRGEYDKNIFMEDKNGNYFDNGSENWNFKEVSDSFNCFYDYTNAGVLNKIIIMTLWYCNWNKVIQNLNIEFVLKSIFKEGIPFSFTSSETYNTIIGIFQSEELLDKEKTFIVFMDIINNCLLNMTEFLNYDNQKSFFLNASKDGVLKVSNSLNLLCSVLNVLLNGTISACKSCKINILAEVDLDQENDLSKMLFSLGKLFTKVLRENTLLQIFLTPQQDADTIPMYIRFIDIRKDKSLDNTIFQDSFLNNMFMVRTWFYKIQFNTSFLFSDVLETLTIETKNINSIIMFKEIVNMETIMMNVINFLNFLVEEGEVHEIFSGLFYLENVLLKYNIFYKDMDKCIEFPTASLFYKFRGNELLFKIVMKMITLMANRVDIEFEDICLLKDHAKIYNKDVKSLAPLVLQQCLELLAGTTKIENCIIKNQDQFEELFKNITIDSSTYCDELIVQTRTLNSFELKKLFEKENLLEFILNEDRKLTDNSLNSILDFILSMVDIKEIMSDNKDIPFLNSGYTKHFQAFREAIQRPDEITDDDLWEKVYEHLVYSYENEKNCNLELILDANKYSNSIEKLTKNFESFKSMPAPLVSTYYPKDVNKTDNLLLNNVKSFLSNTETTDKIDIKYELLKLYPNCKTKIDEFYKTINELLTMI